MKKFFLIVSLLLTSLFTIAQAPGDLCSTAQPFCTGTTYSFPMNTGNTSEVGPDYGCLYTQPNPYWYYLLIDQSGDITIYMESPTGNDIDFICWGPFSDVNTPCTAQLTAGNTVDCSYSINAYESCDISNALSGQYYLMLITNYSNQAGDITFSQSNQGQAGAGSTDCSIICGIQSVTAVPSACDPATNLYSVSGLIVEQQDWPTTGTLVVTDNCGSSQTFNAPFVSPLAYNLTGLNSDGTVHTITVQFSDVPTCNFTLTYISPDNCTACFANAGIDMTYCSLTGILSGLMNPGDIGFWSCATPGVVFGNAFASTTSVTVPTAGSYTFTWNVSTTFGLNCTDNAQYTFSNISADITNLQNVSCAGLCDGELTVEGINGIPPYSYMWNTGYNLPDLTNLCIGVYSPTVTDAIGCTATLSELISSPTPLVLTETHTNCSCFNICDGSATIDAVGGTPPYQFNWSPAGSGTYTNNLCDGSYTVTVTDGNLCTQTITFDITEPTELTTSITGINPTCFGRTDGSIDLTVGGGTTPYVYSWLPAGSSQDLNNLGAGTYSVTVEDNNHCTTTNTIQLIEPAQIVVTTSPIQNICNGQSVDLIVTAIGGSGFYNYSWSNGYIGTTNTVQPNVDTYYDVTVTDDNGCTGNIGHTGVLVTPGVIVNCAISPTAICPGEPAIINASITSGVAPYIVSLNGSVITLPLTVYPEETMTYTLNVLDNCGSTANCDVNIEVYDMPNVSFVADVLSGCAPLNVSFNVLGLDNTYSYFWNFHDASSSSISHDMNPVHEFEEDGTYDITLTITDNHGCHNELTIDNMIVVHPIPHSAFTINPNYVSIVDPAVAFTNLSSGASSFVWTFGDADTSSLINPTHRYDTIGKYNTMLVAISQYGCTDTSYMNVIIHPECTFYAPTGFSPDGDGINDIFRVYGLGIKDSDFQLLVYDRWGEIIWRSNVITYAWDGKVKNNQIAEEGVYTWLCIYYDINNTKHEEAGAITLIR